MWIKCFQSLLPLEQEKLLLFRSYNPSQSMTFGAVGQESITVIDTLYTRAGKKIIVLGYQVSGSLLISNDQE